MNEQTTKTWTPASWNTCPHCEDCVDADDVADGSEVRCLGCETWFTVVEYQDGTFGLSEQSDDEDDAPRETAA